MNANQALSILDNAVANAPLTRANHAAAQQAIQVLAGVIHRFGVLVKQTQEREDEGGGDSIEE